MLDIWTDKKTPLATAFVDGCLDAEGGFSVELGFWWHDTFPLKIVWQRLTYLKDNRDNNLMSINVLVFFRSHNRLLRGLSTQWLHQRM